MKELDECLRIYKEIRKIDDKIETLRAAILSPKNQVITGMPRGGNSDNAIEKYLLKLERHNKRKAKLIKNQAEQWQQAKCKFKNDISAQETKMLYMRFVLGYQWKKCAVKLQKEYGNWNINKCFRIYGKINEKF